MTNFVNAALDLFFPRYCPGCEKILSVSEKAICIQCLSSLPKTGFEQQSILSRFSEKAQIRSAFSYLVYQKDGICQRIVFDFKYHGNKKLAEYLGKMFGKEAAEDGLLSYIDCLIPVPLHRKKLKQRGYNQSEVIAKGFSEASGIPYKTDILQRLSNTETQTNKSIEERKANVKNVFAPVSTEGLEGKHLLIIDDVITSGSTIEACASALLTIKNIKISVCSICKASI